MKNIYKVFFCLILVSYINSLNDGCGIANPSGAGDCKDDTISADDKKNDLVHCCYIEKENKEISGKSCETFTSRQYKNIGKIIKQREEGNEYDYKIKIDCKSSYLKFYLLSLFLFLIWLRIYYFK